VVRLKGGRPKGEGGKLDIFFLIGQGRALIKRLCAKRMLNMVEDLPGKGGLRGGKRGCCDERERFTQGLGRGREHRRRRRPKNKRNRVDE
jgi:hypothetical protein